jgi:hypothetical protein
MGSTSYRHSEDTDIGQILCDVLTKVLEDNLNEFDEKDVDLMLLFCHERHGEETTDENGDTGRNLLIGFTLDLPEETSNMQIVVDEFSAVLHETPPITHALKFEDQLLRKELARKADEIFDLEMKLRRVLSIIYLHAYKHEDPYNLLREETIQPISKEQVKSELMKSATENQFFHLTFSQYLNLNKRPDCKNISDFIKQVRNAQTFEEMRAEIDRTPVEDEDDAVFMAGLKERMDAIESMRNCVAHNRRPSKRVLENYDNVLPLLNNLLDQYLERWACYPDSPERGEIGWDTDTREAVQSALENAEWDKKNGTITFPGEEKVSSDTIVSNREELERYLRELA